MFKNLRDRISKASEEAAVEIEKDVKHGKRMNEKRLDQILWELEIALLEADVALPVVDAIKKEMKSRLVDAKFSRKVDIEEAIEKALKGALLKILGTNRMSLVKAVETGEKPFILMFVGVNGTGKTTTIAKVAHRLMKRGNSCVMAAGDTFRAGAIEQLMMHGDNLGIKVIHQKAKSDPAAVAYDAVEHAKARHKDVVLIDTAGRMQTNINLMDELKKIKRVAKPHLTIFVGDALAGNDAVEQAIKFDAAIGLDGIILCKVDADAKGGSALSITYSLGKPVLYLGIGQEYDQIVPFQPNMFTKMYMEHAVPFPLVVK